MAVTLCVWQVLKAPAGKPFFYRLVDVVVEHMGDVFPTLRTKASFVKVRGLSHCVVLGVDHAQRVSRPATTMSMMGACVVDGVDHRGGVTMLVIWWLPW